MVFVVPVSSSILLLTHPKEFVFVLVPEMATGGADQVWTWKKRKTVAASRAPHTEEIMLTDIMTVPVISSPSYIYSEW